MPTMPHGGIAQPCRYTEFLSMGNTQIGYRSIFIGNMQTIACPGSLDNLERTAMGYNEYEAIYNNEGT